MLVQELDEWQFVSRRDSPVDFDVGDAEFAEARPSALREDLSVDRRGEDAFEVEFFEVGTFVY
jgi:hypothetical protein